MIKKILEKSLKAIPLCITINYLIITFISLKVANGNFYPVSPNTVAVVGSEINAVLIQLLIVIILAITYGGGSVVWDIEEWSILKQTISYYLLNLIPTMTIMYFSDLQTFNTALLVRAFISYTVIFVIIWFANYMFYRSKINKINKRLS